MTPQMRVIISGQNNTGPVFQQVVDDAQRAGKGVKDSTGVAAGGVANLAAQFNDIGVMLASGQSPLILAIQQGTQISQVIGPMGAAGAARALKEAFLSLLSPVTFLTIGSIAAGAALIQWMMGLGDASDSSDQAIAKQAGSLDSVRSQIQDLQGVTDAYARAISGTAESQSIASDSIVANSEREFNAKKKLLELELKRQQILIKTSQLELQKLGQDLRQEIAKGTVGVGVANDVAGGFSDPKIGQFVRSPANDNLLQRTQELIESSPLTDKMSELRLNIELAEIATAGLEEALGVTFGESVAVSVANIGDKTKSTKENFGAFLDLVNEGQAVFEATRTPFEVLGAELGRLDQLLAMGVISWDTYHRAVNRATMGAASDALGSISQITGALAGAFQDNKAIAAANIVVNTAQGITKALAEGGPFGFPIAAAIGVAGAAQLATVLSAQPGGATSAPTVNGSAGGGVAAAAPAAAAPAGPSVYLQLHGSRFSREDVEDLIKQINSAVGDGVRLKVA